MVNIPGVCCSKVTIISGLALVSLFKVSKIKIAFQMPSSEPISPYSYIVISFLFSVIFNANSMTQAIFSPASPRTSGPGPGRNTAHPSKHCVTRFGCAI